MCSSDLVLWTVFSLKWSYSEGDRGGVLQKFSSKGWICKTWEGELALYVVPGMAPEIWAFSVRDEALARQLGGFVGERVHGDTTTVQVLGEQLGALGDA